MNTKTERYAGLSRTGENTDSICRRRQRKIRDQVHVSNDVAKAEIKRWSRCRRRHHGWWRLVMVVMRMVMEAWRARSMEINAVRCHRRTVPRRSDRLMQRRPAVRSSRSVRALCSSSRILDRTRPTTGVPRRTVTGFNSPDASSDLFRIVFTYENTVPASPCPAGER